MRWIWAVIVPVAAIPLAWADEDDALRQENARLRARIEALERENARLRALVPPAVAAGEPAVTVSEDPDGTMRREATVSLTVIGGSRAAHELRLTDDADGTRATVASTLSGGIHRHVDGLDLEIDDRIHHLPVSDYDATRVTGGSPQRRRRLDHERVTVMLPEDVLGAAATATSVGGRLGRVRFVVDAHGQQALAAFARDVIAAREASTRP